MPATNYYGSAMINSHHLKTFFLFYFKLSYKNISISNLETGNMKNI